MNKRIICIVSLLFLFSTYVLGQTQKITGIVVDNDDAPIIGAYVIEKGTANGTVSDLDGNFTLTVKTDAIVTVSMMSFISQEVKIGKNTNKLYIKLVDQTLNLDELVVVGYGVQKKSDITGSISSISGEDLKVAPVASSAQAIQGRASGVQVTQNTGSPGGKTTIKIRGTGTINDSDPLYVVDGFIVNNIDHINPNDIANIEILKDAASSSIYGARGANGVILITTNSGQAGKIKIEFDSYLSLSSPWKEIKVMSTDNFALMRDYVTGNNSYSADGVLYQSKDASGNLYYDAAKFQRLDSLKRNSPSNWWNAITRTGIKEQTNLSLSGGTDLHRYMVSANYFNEEGIVRGSDYQRISTRMNLSNTLARWLTMQTNMLYTNSDRNIIPEGQNSVLKRALSQSPLVYTYNSLGYFSENHPIAQIARNHNNLKGDRFDINTQLTAKINKMFTYQFKFSDYLESTSQKQFAEVEKLDENFEMPTDLTTIQVDKNTTNKWEVNNLLMFNWSKGKHNIDAVVGQTIESQRYNVLSATKKGTSSNEDVYQYLSSGYTGDIALEDAYDWTALGYLGRVNYSFVDRYLLQVNFRADASSKFNKNNRWGYFPSVSLGWKFSEENFMSSLKWLSLGKLRVGWGQLGNNRIAEYAQYTLLENQYNYSYGSGNHVLFPGKTSTSLGNSDIRWEKTESANIGLDLGFLDNKFMVTVDLFDKRTTDMLLRVPVVVSAGLINAPMINAGAIKNRGIELNMNYRSKIQQVKFDLGFNVSYIKNKVTSLGSNNEPVWGAYLSEGSVGDYVTKTEVGRAIGCFYGYITDGIFNTVAEVEASAQNDGLTKPGDFRFKDLNNDGRITAEDRTYLGSPHPDFVFGVPISVSYKHFDLNLFFQGQTGNKIFNVMEYYLNSAHGTGNVYENIRSKHWSGGEGARSFYPVNWDVAVPDLDAADLPRNFRASDFYVKDGSYVRLKNVQINYNFSEAVCQKLRVDRLTFYVSGYNLLTFTKYNGFDPEIGKNTGSETNNLYMGVDHGNYPQARTITLGFKLGL